ncbi:MAG: TIGR02453 family protein [Bacteroidetes bacterium]|nr:TIGR02453 family protein [Bacteroidota bacterium]
MAWFTKDYEKFFKELSSNNNREWFTDNKKRYEQHVKKPFYDFVGDLILRMQKYDKDCRIEPKDAVFRIYRDIRFSKDKTPYKTQMSAIISSGGRKNMTKAGMYVEVGHKHLRLYGGLYSPDKDQLNSVRQEILYNLEEFNRVTKDKKFVKYFDKLRGEQNKRLPKEYAEIQEAQPLIANKQFYYYTELDPELLRSESLIDELYQAYEASLKVQAFLYVPVADK